MARIRTRLPKVFVGHPFGGRFAVSKFRRLFRELPFVVIYGDTHLQTKHLLQIMKQNINQSDFSIFDLSGWNSNVALELGLAEGLKRNAEKEYFILLNTRRSKEVPSDIRGLQRLEYTSYDYKPQSGLGDVLLKGILAKEYWIKTIKKHFSNDSDMDKKLLLAVKILAHLRDHEKLTRENVKSLVRGTRLRESKRDSVLLVLKTLKLIKNSFGGNVYELRKKIFS